MLISLLVLKRQQNYSMILLPNNESYVDMRNEKLVFLVTTLRFGWRSYVQRQTRMYNLSYNFTGAH